MKVSIFRLLIIVNQKFIVFCLIILSLMGCKSTKITDKNLFSKTNLIPWAIVGFDVKERSPKDRIEMLKDLGYIQYGYGHRKRHIPTMAEEWQLARKMGIDVKAVWVYINLNKDKVGALRTQNEVVFNNLKAVGLKTQIWVGVDSKFFENLTDQQSMNEATSMIEYLSQRAKSLGCKIALYNHGGWYGKPENQLRIIRTLPQEDIGVVFNFHHAHDNLKNYKEQIKNLLPYLWCVNLNGMRAEGPKILTIGEGDLEKEMIQQLLDLNYKGSFGILGHVKGGDPEVILKNNEEGLIGLFN